MFICTGSKIRQGKTISRKNDPIMESNKNEMDRKGCTTSEFKIKGVHHCIFNVTSEIFSLVGDQCFSNPFKADFLFLLCWGTAGGTERDQQEVIGHS